MKIKMSRIGLLMCASVLIFSFSCGSDAPADSSNPPTVDGSRDVAETKNNDTKEANLGFQTQGVFNRLWSDPPTLDPHLTSDTTSSAIVVEIFGGLVAFDTSLKLIPDLAQAWDISQDGMTYTFYIRSDAKFHDGKKVTAEDFKWSLDRAANPNTASPVAETYLGDIIGVEDVLKGNTDSISGVTVVDVMTLEIKIDAPKAYFLAKLTYPTAYVLDKNNVESGGRNWTDSPNGTGAFSLLEYKIGERLILERNEHYHLGTPGLERIQMNLAGGASMAMYENDEIDITGVSLFDLERIRDPSDSLHGDLIIANPGYSISYIGFNVNEPPFDDPKFRQALNHAVDKDLIAKEVMADMVVPAYGILPPGFPGYQDVEGLKYDPVLAKKLLSESRYADPNMRPRIVITIPGSGGTPNLDLEVIINMWYENLGVEVEIQQVEWATYLQDLDRQRFQSFGGLGWEADYPDPQDFLDILFHSESDNNHGAYANGVVDSILETARVETDQIKRFELYNKVENMIVEDAAWLPLWFAGERHILLKSYVKGYEITPMIVPKMRHVYIE